MIELFEDFRDILVELHKAGARFVVLGGHAVAFHGQAGRNRHRGLRYSLRSPATPPGMRVRTGRFEELRLRGQPRDAQLVEVAIGEGLVNEQP